MRLNHGFDQTQSQAQSPLGAALVCAIKPVPYARNFLRRDADAGIFDRDYRLAFCLATVNGYAAPLWCVFDGVVEQIGENLAHAIEVSSDAKVFGTTDGQRDLFIF